MVTMFEQLHNIVTQANETTPVHKKRTVSEKEQCSKHETQVLYIQYLVCVRRLSPWLSLLCINVFGLLPR